METNDIVIDPIPEYFNDSNISPCGTNASLTCNSFITDQSFKSNLTARIYKLKPMSNLPVDHRMLCTLYTAFDVV